jgi:hypothetical protein
LTPAAVGEHWSISNIQKLLHLSNKGVIHLIEATQVTDRNADFNDALQAGYENLSNLKEPQKFDTAIDIQASRKKIQPL